MSASPHVGDHTSSQPPSTAITLTNLMCTSTAPRPTVTPSVHRCKSSTVGPSSLPTETLMSIFQFVFEACVDWRKTSTFDPNHVVVWLEDDLLSPFFFPYSLASVCVRWLHILSSVAVHWTRQVIIVNTHTTSPIAIQTALRWAGNLPLQLVIRRDPSISEGGEERLIQEVSDLLRPHIHQIWSLIFGDGYNLLPPALWREESCLQHLSVSTSISRQCGTSRFPKEVVLCEHFLKGVFLGQINLWLRNITSLTIHGYATSERLEVSLHKFVTMIQTCCLLQQLSVEDIAFVNDIPSSGRLYLEVPVIRLQRITDADAFKNIVSQTIGIRSKEVVTLSGCSFNSFGKRSSYLPGFSSDNLILEGMNATATAIRQLVCFWNGENLSLINCPGVSASFLREVPTGDTPPDLRRLQIIDCENASAGGLMGLVKSREVQSVVDALIPRNAHDKTCTALVELHVHGRGPPIGAEQAAWLVKHLDTFSWDTVASDGTRYTWNTVTGELNVLRTSRVQIP